MQAARWAAAVVVACSLGAAATSTVVASPAIASARATASADLEASAGVTSPDAIAFRRAFGFATDPTYLDQLAANDLDGSFGVPLSTFEVAELRLRQVVARDDAGVIRRYFAGRRGPTLGGLWIDNQGGGNLTVAVVGDRSVPERDLKALVLHPDRLRFHTATVPLSELVELGRRLLHTPSQSPAYKIVATAVDEPNGRVRVLVDGDVAFAQKSLGDLRAVAEGASPRVVGSRGVDSPPFKGGTEIVDQVSGFACSSGFGANNGWGAYFIITAGHCGRIGTTWLQGGLVYMGALTRRALTEADGGAISINTNTRSNLITLRYSPYLGQGEYRNITSAQDPFSDVVGEVECITARNFEGARCGSLRSRNFAYTGPVDDGTLSYSNGREAEVTCNPGDSGGSAFVDNQARGIISLKVVYQFSRDTCVYSHIGDVAGNLGLLINRS